LDLKSFYIKNYFHEKEIDDQIPFLLFISKFAVYFLHP